MNYLAINLVFSTAVFWIAAKIYLLPKLDRLEPRAVLVPILLLHSTRHLGLMFLARGAVHPDIPAVFAYPAAIGDLVAALLALLCLAAVSRRWSRAGFLLWVFSLEGLADLAAAIVLATVYGANNFMGAAYWIPALWVPALLVSHVIVIRVLRRCKSRI